MNQLIKYTYKYIQRLNTSNQVFTKTSLTIFLSDLF
jgi:hypothetical protein